MSNYGRRFKVNEASPSSPSYAAKTTHPVKLTVSHTETLTKTDLKFILSERVEYMSTVMKQILDAQNENCKQIMSMVTETVTTAVISAIMGTGNGMECSGRLQQANSAKLPISI